ncbi:MAG: hypothetical protein COU69_03455 [Candidatus Pacebacteria bacterium CG10_big_fil_rev_8_21_14_0_10_56_10]|nr:MAG: hypothetical protein COU69_03455 [Candidatus Pacebacteria bacterium CG10_big_fil_rev_8_21_14_0_10_56_10]
MSRHLSSSTKPAAAVAGLVVLAVLVIGLVVGSMLVRRSQDVRQQAQTDDQAGPTASLAISPAIASRQKDQTFSLNVMFTAENVPISAVTARVSLPNPENNRVIAASNLRIAADLSNSADWACPVSQINNTPTHTQIDVSCVNTAAAGATFPGVTKLATFDLVTTNLPQTNPLPIELDTSLSMVSAKDVRQPLSTSLTDGRVTFSDPAATPPSPPPGPPTGTELTLDAKFNGITTDRGPITALVKLGRVGNTSQLFDTTTEFTFAQNGQYQAKVGLPASLDLTKGRFWLTVKGEKHLQRVFRPLDLSVQHQLDLTAKPFQPGDLPPQDGVLNIADLDKVLEVMALPGPTADQLNSADVNFDGVVNAFDMGLVLQTLSVKVDEGDAQ